MAKRTTSSLKQSILSSELHCLCFPPGRQHRTGRAVELPERSGVNNWDMSLQKTIPFKERVSLQIRLDAFNVFNHTQFSGINSTLNFSGTFANGVVTINPVPTNLAFDPSTGTVLNTGGFGAVSRARPRVMQAVVRLVF